MRVAALALLAAKAVSAAPTSNNLAGQRSSIPRGDVDLVNSNDLVYMANVTIGGVAYTIQLDSGSSDLWVKPPSGSFSGATSTSLTLNISYAIGYAAGNIVTAPVQFVGLTVPSQAVLEVTDSNNPIFSYGASGILGLGFDGLSNIDATISNANASNGHSFLYNAFAQDTSTPNSVAVQLERKNGLPTDIPSLISIGDLEPDYQNITLTQPISTWPVSLPTRWTILLDGYEYADGVKRTLTTAVQDAPSTVILLDTGSSYAYAPQDVVNGLYSSIQGASFDSGKGMWSVPCDQEVNFALWIGGRKFDWHPLDVVVPYLGDNSTCVGSIIPSPAVEGYDLLGGDVFLRSLYTVFDFGDFDSNGNMGDPYVRLWSLIDQPTASADFHKVRGGTPQPYKSSTTASANAASSNANVATNASAGSGDVASTEQLSQDMKTLVGYAPIALGVLGLNAVLLVVILGLGIWWMCRGKRSKKNRTTNGTGPSSTSLGNLPNLSRNHSYKQVSGNEAETPRTAKFPDDVQQPLQRKNSHSSSYYADHAISPTSEGEITAVNDSFRMSTFNKDPSIGRMSVLAPSTKGSMNLGPSNLSHTSLPPSPTNGEHSSLSPDNGDSAPGVRSPSPSPGSQRAPSPANSPLRETFAASSQSDGPPLIEVDPPAPATSRRAQEYLAAMEARKAALGGDARRNTYHEDADEPLQPPQRRLGVNVGAPDGRRAMSSYMGVEPEPLQVPERRQPTPRSRESMRPAPQGQGNPPEAEPLASPPLIAMPPGPSRSQEALAAMEARRTALGGADDGRRNTYHDPEALQPPQRRFQGAGGQSGRPNTYIDPNSNGVDRSTIYFDAPDSHNGETPPQSPMGASTIGSQHARTPSGASAVSHRRGPSGAGPTRSSLLATSPSRASFNPAAQRSQSNLNPNAGPPSTIPSRPAPPAPQMSMSGHGRSGSYAGMGSSLPPSTLGPPGMVQNPASWNRSRVAAAGVAEEDLTEQRHFDNTGDDAFADTPPRRPFAAGGSTPAGYRFSSVH